MALQPVQDRRDQTQVPGGMKLHQYANLYFHARNPMMYKRQTEVANLCVLRVSINVLRIGGAAITDQNAASSYVRFLAPQQWSVLDFDDIFAMDWNHPDDQIRHWRHKSRKCAEALVPHAVEPRFVIGAYVADQTAAALITAVAPKLRVVINPILFFR